MINKRLDDISKEDIDGLVADAVCERRNLEYKAELPGGRDEDRREFLADVSSFANTAGGDLIYGVRDQCDETGQPTGVPEDAPGLAGVNADQQIRRMEQMIRQGVSPVIQGIELRAIDGFADGPVIVLRAPESAIRPHMVTYKNLSRFYGRTSAGKYQLDVTELRSAFLGTEELPRRLRAFRDERISMILSGQTPLPMDQSAKMVLHVIPFASMTPGFQVPPTRVENIKTALKPMGVSSWDYRYNADGYATYHARNSGLTRSYVQVFRNGAIEAIEADFTNEHKGRMKVASVAYERELIDMTDSVLTALRNLDVRPPAAIFLSLLGVKGAYMATSDWWGADEHVPFDREVVRVPEVIVNGYEGPVARILRPIFDAVWQSAGFAGSYNYNPEGQWVGQRR